MNPDILQLASFFIAVIVFILFSALFIWTASKIFKFKETKRIKALSASAIAAVPAAAVFLILQTLNAGIVSVIVTPLCFVLFLAFSIKYVYREDAKKTAYATAFAAPFAIICAIFAMCFIFFLSFFYSFYAQAIPVLDALNAGSSWGDIRPVAKTAFYVPEGRFGIMFLNMADAPVNITSMTAREINEDTECLHTLSLFPHVTAGTQFVEGYQCPEKKEGESYDVEIDIEYVKYGEDVIHKEHGHITGEVE
jgi:Ca2+/Na+ antiporter